MAPSRIRKAPDAPFAEVEAFDIIRILLLLVYFPFNWLGAVPNGPKIVPDKIAAK